jgi:plastocyanin
MRRLAAAAGAALLLVASGTNALAVGDSVSINIVDAPRPTMKWGYAPATRKVAAGTWVTWSNAGQDGHTVTAVDGSFDSGNLDPSEGFSWYFDQSGTFEYVCTLHPWMSGTIIVAGDAAGDSGQPSAISGQQPGSDAASEDQSG